MFDFINLKNPKINMRNMDFEGWINKQNRFVKICFLCTKNHNPLFHLSYTTEEVNMNGLLLEYPVCELPKFGIFNNFHKLNNGNLSLKTEEFKLKHFFPVIESERKIFGRFEFKKENGFKFYVRLNNLSTDYLKTFYETIQEGYELRLLIVIQKIQNMLKYPIIEIALSVTESSKNHKFSVEKERSLLENHPMGFMNHFNIAIPAVDDVPSTDNIIDI